MWIQGIGFTQIYTHILHQRYSYLQSTLSDFVEYIVNTLYKYIS